MTMIPFLTRGRMELRKHVSRKRFHVWMCHWHSIVTSKGQEWCRGMEAWRRESIKTDDRNEQQVTRRARNSKDDLGDCQESALSKGRSNKTSFKQQGFTEKKNPRVVSANYIISSHDTEIQETSNLGRTHSLVHKNRIKLVHIHGHVFGYHGLWGKSGHSRLEKAATSLVTRQNSPMATTASLQAFQSYKCTCTD